jgi:hypothetical protein
VEEITPARHIKSKLQDCQANVQQQGAAFITTGGFDVLFSLLQVGTNRICFGATNGICRSTTSRPPPT